jgi:hypothetical protein
MNDGPKEELPPEEPPPPLRLGRVFWMSLALGLTCVIAGYLFSRLAPTFLPPR